MRTYLTPHLQKLTATLSNENLPKRDKSRVERAIKRYKHWIAKLDTVNGSPEEVINEMVELLNEYKLYIEAELIFDSEDDFLYRQKGQLKLDNSIIEEFLPHLIKPSIIPEVGGMELEIGPIDVFSSLYFASSLSLPQAGGGISIRTKAHDFAISRRLYLKSSYAPNFEDAVVKDTYIAYITAECKTNLDKTMFQEACATAHDVKSAVPGAKYFLICEWLDMTPLSTAPTDIDEVILLRKGKRLNSNIRQYFNTSRGRRERRQEYVNYLKQFPLMPERFQRLVNHIRSLIRNEQPVEEDVLERGYF